MEQTHLRAPERLSKLLALLTLAFCWCYHVGYWQAQIKPIRRLKHTRPAYSLFRYGLNYLNKFFFAYSTKTMQQFLQVLAFLFNKQPLNLPPDT